MSAHPRLLLSFAALLALAACGPIDHHGGAGGDVPSGATTFLIDAGAGLSFTPTAPTYVITSNGGVFRILATDPAGANHEYFGSVYTQGFLSVDGTESLEPNDFITGAQIVPNGKRVDFDFHGHGQIKAFTVSVSVEPLYFHLYIDGQPATGDTLFPSAGIAATTDVMPFGLVEQ